MKKITLEHLAAMVRRGFDEMATKKEMTEGFGRLEDGPRSIATSQRADQADIAELRHRVTRLERKAGIAR